MTAVKEAPAKAQAQTAGWKTILVHVQSGGEAPPRLLAAVDLARAHDALLIGLGAELIEPAAFSDPYGACDGVLIAALREQVQTNLKRAEEIFRRCAKGARTEWRRVEDRPCAVLARVARAADMIVTGGTRESPRDGFRAADTAELVLTSGRPVLVVPPQGGTLAGRRVVVAWKETREARRALADALPLLARADEVRVLEVCDQAGVEDAEFHTDEVVKGLGRHGIKAVPRVVAASDARVAAILNEEAAAAGADLIVAGCYGHSRMNEWLFGGATRELLETQDRFILMSH